MVAHFVFHLGFVHFGSVQGENHGGDLPIIRYASFWFICLRIVSGLRLLTCHTSHPGFGWCLQVPKYCEEAAWLQLYRSLDYGAKVQGKPA